MDTLDDIASYFDSEIERIVAGEELKLKTEIEELKEQTKHKVELSAKQSVMAYKKQKEEDLLRDTALSKSLIKQKYYKLLSDKRSEIASQTFDLLLNRINLYTKTSEYEKQLYEAVKKVCSDRVKIYVRKEDFNLVKELNVECNSDITLGGFIIAYQQSNKLEDRTIDLLVEDQKAWFYENSGLEDL